MAFRSDIWVSNDGSNTLMRIRQEDGKILRRYPTDEYPTDVLVAGESIWVANYNSHTVSTITPGQP